MCLSVCSLIATVVSITIISVTMDDPAVQPEELIYDELLEHIQRNDLPGVLRVIQQRNLVEHRLHYYGWRLMYETRQHLDIFRHVVSISADDNRKGFLELESEQDTTLRSRRAVFVCSTGCGF